MIEFALLRNVRVPVRAFPKSSGIDLFVPQMDDAFIKTFNSKNLHARSMSYYDDAHKNIYVYPHGQVMIPSGLLVNFSGQEDSTLIALNRGSVSWEPRLTLLACNIDQDFQGELFISMQNYSDLATIIMPDMKLTQVVRVPVFYDEINIVSKDDIHKTATERGKGALGSSGK
jgi:dUTPase